MWKISYKKGVEFDLLFHIVLLKVGIRKNQKFFSVPHYFLGLFLYFWSDNFSQFKIFPALGELPLTFSKHMRACQRSKAKSRLSLNSRRVAFAHCFVFLRKKDSIFLALRGMLGRKASKRCKLYTIFSYYHSLQLQHIKTYMFIFNKVSILMIFSSEKYFPYDMSHIYNVRVAINVFRKNLSFWNEPLKNGNNWYPPRRFSCLWGQTFFRDREILTYFIRF